jgi:hypothetical protein
MPNAAARLRYRLSVEHFDGGYVEGWYFVTDGMVTLCDVTGAAHPERRRYAIGDSEETIAKELLRCGPTLLAA